MRWTHLACGALVGGGLMIAACGDDETCGDANNMSNVRVAEGFDATAASPELHLLWDAGVDEAGILPAAYFDEPQVVESSVEILAVTHPEDRELVIRFASLANTLESDEALTFTLEFPDRRDFIQCTHPGMDDAYLLSGTLTFEENGGLADSTFQQTVSLGDI